MTRSGHYFCGLVVSVIFLAGCAGSNAAAEPSQSEPTPTAAVSPDVQAPEPTAPVAETPTPAAPQSAPEPPATPLPTPTVAAPEPASDTVVAQDEHTEVVRVEYLLPEDLWPSFRCDGELDDVEAFLCTHGREAAADREFAEYWQSYIAEREAHPLLSELIEIQQDWLAYGPRRACLHPDIDQYRSRDCMSKVYAERQNALTHARTVRTDLNTWSLAWGPFSSAITVTDVETAITVDQADTADAVESLVDVAEAHLQLVFQSDPQLSYSSGTVDITITQTHGQRLTTFGWSEAGFIQPSVHPYFNFREFIYDRDTQAFIEMSDLVRSEHHADAATVLVDSMTELALQSGSFSYLRQLTIDELEFAPVFDDAGLIVAFENSSNAETLGSYAGRICFYGLQVPATRLIDFVADGYIDLFSPDLVDDGTTTPYDCE